MTPDEIRQLLEEDERRARREAAMESPKDAEFCDWCGEPVGRDGGRIGRLVCCGPCFEARRAEDEN